MAGAAPASFLEAEEALHTQAREATGLDDFGDTSYQEGLRTLLQGWDEESELSALGRQAMCTQVVASLKGRLYSQQGWASYPAFENARIERPLFIVGLPRTGTTALHHLMARDPDVQALELWLGEAPKPRPQVTSWPADPQYRECVARMEARRAASPDMDAIHPMAPELADECWHLMSQDFVNCTYECNATLPSYSRWYAEHDLRPVYRRHRANLQLIGHREPRRWLLKDANHLFDLDALLDVYPDACVVFTHRDPVKLIPSVCSLLRSSRALLDARLDLRQLGRSQMDLWERGIYHSLEVRRKSADAHFFDLYFHDFLADPLGSIQRIYAHFGFPYTDAAEVAIRDWQRAHPPGGHGPHHYALEEFELVEGEILERFEAYVRAFDIPRD